MSENRDFKGVWIPKEVWLDTRLNALEKVILTEIDSLDNGEKGCYASNEHLAEFCQCSKTKVSTAIKKLVNSGSMYLRAHISALSFQLARLLRSSPSAEVNRSPLPDLMTAILYFLPLHSVQMRSTSNSISLFCWSSFVSHTSTIFDFSNMFTSMVHHSFTLSFGIIYLHYSFSHLLFICSFYLFFQLRRLPYLPEHSLYLAFSSKKTPAFLKVPRKDSSAYVTANAEKSAGTARPMWNSGCK